MSLLVKDANGTNRTVPTNVDAAAYSYGKADFAAVATPTTALVIQGSATKVVRVKRIRIAGAATAAGSIVAYIERWSTAGTLGTAVLTAITAAKRDSTSGNATAVVSTVGTANYQTKGTTAGVVAAGRVSMQAIGSAATSGEGQGLEFTWGDKGDEAIVLRGTGEHLVIDFNGAGIPTGGKFDFTVDVEESAA
jgi:hypothetical protein